MKKSFAISRESFIAKLKHVSTFRLRANRTCDVYRYRSLHVIRLTIFGRHASVKETWLIEDSSVFWPDLADAVMHAAKTKEAG